MKRESVVKLLERVGLHIRVSDANGITINRTGGDIKHCADGENRRVGVLGGSYCSQNWRLYCGSGIACNSGRWWLRYEQSEPFGRLLGPFKTAKELEAELRRWRRWESP